MLEGQKNEAGHRASLATGLSQKITAPPGAGDAAHR